jgi:hypothetical protein
MPALNSYILYSHVSGHFQAQMETAIDNLHIAWWQPTHLPVHLTLGQCMGAFKDTHTLITRRNAEFKTKIKDVISANEKNSAFLLPVDIEITKTGWIIFKYETVNFESQETTGTEPTNIKKIHTGFEATVTNLQNTYPLKPDPWGKNFMPHISMGKIKTQNANGTPSPAEIEQAQRDLLKNKTVILAELNKLRTLNLYDLELVYNDTQGNADKLYQKTLQRRDFNIVTVSNRHDYIEINFNHKNDANRFISFLIIVSGEAHATHSADKKSFTVHIRPKNYEYLVGIVAGCHKISALTMLAPAATEQKTPAFQLSASAPVFKPKLNASAPLFQPAALAAPTEIKDTDILAIYGVDNKKNVTLHGKHLIILAFKDQIIALEFAEMLQRDFNIVSSAKILTGKPKQKTVRQEKKSYTVSLSENEYEKLLDGFRPAPSAKTGLKNR